MSAQQASFAVKRTVLRTLVNLLNDRLDSAMVNTLDIVLDPDQLNMVLASMRERADNDVVPLATAFEDLTPAGH